MKTIVLQALEDTLGYKRATEKKEWFDSVYERVIGERKQARMKMLQRETRATRQEYEDKRRIAKKKECKKKKQEFEKTRLEELNNCHKEEEVRIMYKGIKEIKRGWQPQTNLCRDKAGNFIGDKNEILKRWEEYFKELLNSSEQADIPINEPNGVDEEVQEPTLEEVIEVIKKMSNHRALAEDRIPAEV